MSAMPVDRTIPDIKAALRDRGGAVLVAAPGAGKTTRVPIALMGEPWLAGRKIVMLEPRRIAARSAAEYMAAGLGERAGARVGYRVRMDTKAGPKTVVEVVTEGVLTRMLQQDPSLAEVGLVIFDEFHERNLNGDLGLALCLQARSLFRDDLRLLVMSATLEPEPVAGLLGGVPVIESAGMMYPVETVYLDRRSDAPVERLAAEATALALGRHDGDALVFLPGYAEIRRTAAALSARLRGAGAEGVEIAALHGSMPPGEQDRALAPAANGGRKVVLATPVAESSLTVEGVRIVIDGGLMRAPRFSPRTGMSRLETARIPVSSADQRRGRAGRVAPGVCYRLWTEEEHRQLAQAGTPEIREADLAPLALELAVWGVSDPAELDWLDVPPAAAYTQARELLSALGAIGTDGAPTPHGAALARLGAHPRLAHMMLRALPLGLAADACRIAALLGDRDPMQGGDADLSLRLAALAAGDGRIEAGRRERLLAEARQFEAQLNNAIGESAGAGAAARADAATGSGLVASAGAVAGSDSVPGAGSATGSGSVARTASRSAQQSAYDCGLLLAFAYPDRIGKLRGGGKFTLSGGRGAYVPEGQPLAGESWIVAAELDDQGTEGRIRLAAPLRADDLERHFGDLVAERRAIAWEPGAGAVRARRTIHLGALTLREGPIADPDPAAVSEALLSGIRFEGLDLLPWSKSSRQWLERARFAALHDPAGWPDLSEAALLNGLEDWLGPFVIGMRTRGDLQRLQMAEALSAMLSWEQRRRLDEEAPTHVALPSGSRLPVDYSDPAAPALHARLQELFGWPASPRIAGGRVPLTLHLLSPAQRPVQVTRDLASFWREAYFEVRKDLKGRYPKHYWPDDPMQAQATSRVRPRT
ncbi:ATP-dependent helicase HrpB [Cohnella hashimotonis]|uniref:ATP-dependent helicase HrpB n=1 Tax=Cohnella hashimotonis TaxID=2826895 RepID=A0ABT6TL66_9BACL|nr:ATP-dependent helicase HrpB [Cohnella hashimotonis]MDI4647601.1 ATP-dependent helicase HrpB [Cohnella hashimotonis]